jgi:phosphatidylglycerophosphate synthase
MTSPTSRMPGPDSPGRPGQAGQPVPQAATTTKPPEVEELVDEYLHRPLARRLVRVLARTPITPNQVTLLSALVGISAGVAVSRGARNPAALLLGGGLLFSSVVLDCCDGQLARLRGISSTTGAILDGIADYAVGIAMGVGASIYMAAVHGSPWLWLLGLAGIASSAVQSALFDHAKTRYIARVGGGYAEREECLDRVSASRARAWREGRRREAVLLWIYQSYSRAQHAAMSIAPAEDPVAYRAANAGRMRAWTFLGIGTHFALAYLLCLAARWWPPAIAVYFLCCATLLNLALAVLMSLEGRQVAA